jgi:hypothetical protein
VRTASCAPRPPMRQTGSSLSSPTWNHAVAASSRRPRIYTTTRDATIRIHGCSRPTVARRRLEGEVETATRTCPYTLMATKSERRNAAGSGAALKLRSPAAWLSEKRRRLSMRFAVSMVPACDAAGAAVYPGQGVVVGHARRPRPGDAAAGHHLRTSSGTGGLYRPRADAGGPGPQSQPCVAISLSAWSASLAAENPA